MRYKEFGRTGKQISVISFGGMRFPEPDNMARCVDLILYAHQNGINYFDTAPLYCEDRSELIFGRALAQLPRNQVYVSTKSGRANGSDLRKQLEQSLTRLGTDRIDFFYIWHLMTPDDWEKRKQGGAVAAAVKAKEEGLISHLLCSSHMQGETLAQVLMENLFDGVLLGYNALNFPYRQKALDQAAQQKLGVVTMNPLAGGLIPRNPHRFAFLKQTDEDTVVKAALRFNLSQPAVTSALVGFADSAEVDEALSAAMSLPTAAGQEARRLEPNIENAFDHLCTGCGYCLPCPVDIPIPEFMDVYNQVILNPAGLTCAPERFRMHWGISARQAGNCIECRACEDRCTQHLPIVERLKKLAS